MHYICNKTHWCCAYATKIIWAGLHSYNQYILRLLDNTDACNYNAYHQISEHPDEALNELDKLLSAPMPGEGNGSPNTTASDVDFTAAAFLLSSINNRLKEAGTVDSDVSKVCKAIVHLCVGMV